MIDTCAYVPRAVETSCSALAGRTGQYLFVSTVSVYPSVPGAKREDDELLPAIDSTEDVNGETYGGLKVSCERVVERVFGSDATIVRPGLIVGPHDHTERFTYWPIRFADGGEVMVPDCGDRHLTSLDVRDFADFMVRLLEQGWKGTVNVDRSALTWPEMVAAAQEIWEFDPVWVSETFIVENGIEHWSGLPVFAPESFGLGDPALALELGLRNRAIGQTLKDVHDDARSRGLARPLKAGPSEEAERTVIEKWKSR